MKLILKLLRRGWECKILTRLDWSSRLHSTAVWPPFSIYWPYSVVKAIVKSNYQKSLSSHCWHQGFRQHGRWGRSWGKRRKDFLYLILINFLNKSVTGSWVSSIPASSKTTNNKNKTLNLSSSLLARVIWRHTTTLWKGLESSSGNYKINI